MRHRPRVTCKYTLQRGIHLGPKMEGVHTKLWNQHHIHEEWDGRATFVTSNMHAQFTPALRAFQGFYGVMFSLLTIDGNVALPQTQSCALPLVLIIFKCPRFSLQKSLHDCLV